MTQDCRGRCRHAQYRGLCNQNSCRSRTVVRILRSNGKGTCNNVVRIPRLVRAIV